MVGLILQVPVFRRRVFAWMERLAEWHEKGTREEVKDYSQGDPFMLAKAGEKMLERYKT